MHCQYVNSHIDLSKILLVQKVLNYYLLPCVLMKKKQDQYVVVCNILKLTNQQKAAVNNYMYITNLNLTKWRKKKKRNSAEVNIHLHWAKLLEHEI